MDNGDQPDFGGNHNITAARLSHAREGEAENAKQQLDFTHISKPLHHPITMRTSKTGENNQKLHLSPPNEVVSFTILMITFNFHR